ncbi:MAG: ABC transporter permease [Prevotella sp.]|nr:ABC transporter permease [Prevotella sp.]
MKALYDALYIWRQEMRQVVRDEGVLIFFIVVPIVYPLLYSWIYNNEVLRDVPVAVVDDSKSAMSRDFIRRCDATPEVKVLCFCADLDEAKSLVSRQVVKGIYYLPPDFANHTARMEQTFMSVYCDMSLVLAYKNIFAAARLVSLDMGSEIQAQLSSLASGGRGVAPTARQAEVSARPLDYDEVPIFNPAGGYGSFILPGVLMLILQQTLVLGIGLSAGTARENNRYGDLIPLDRHYSGVHRIVYGKALCYLMVFTVMAAYLSLLVPRLFGFPQLAAWRDIALMLIPYLLASTFFGMFISCMVRYRENVMLLIVFVSVPLLFMSGIPWPLSSIPGTWQGVSWIFPSTFGVRAFVRLNSMGASLSDVRSELLYMWIQAGLFYVATCMVYRHQLMLTQQHTLSRLKQLRRKLRVRAEMKDRAVTRK